MRRCGDWPNLLSDGSGHQPSVQISHNDPPNATRWFLQRHPHRGMHFVGDTCLCERPTEEPKLLTILFRIQEWAEMFCGPAAAPSGTLEILQQTTLGPTQTNLQRRAIATEVVLALGCAIPQESCRMPGATSRACRPADAPSSQYDLISNVFLKKKKYNNPSPIHPNMNILRDCNSISIE